MRIGQELFKYKSHSIMQKSQGNIAQTTDSIVLQYSSVFIVYLENTIMEIPSRIGSEDICWEVNNNLRSPIKFFNEIYQGYILMCLATFIFEHSWYIWYNAAIEW